MLNTIRADIYRIVRGKGLYITFALLLGLVILVVTTSETGTIGVQIDMEEMEQASGIDPEGIVYNGLNIPALLCTSMDNIVWFTLPLLIFIAGPMFSHGTVKNELSHGMSRAKLYFAKLLLSSAMCLLLIVFYVLAGIITATILRGYGGVPQEGYWLSIIKTCGAQLFILLALNSIGIFLAFTTKNTAMVNGTFIAFCVVPLIVIMFLSMANPELAKLGDYELTSTIKKFGYLDILPAADIVMGFVVGGFYLIASTAAGVLLFKRAEIK